MTKSVASMKRVFPRLTIPLLIGLLLALPLTACGSKSDSGSTAKVGGTVSVDPAMVSGGPLRAPAPTIIVAKDCTNCAGQGSATLGERAAVAATQGNAKCNAKLQYGNGWAKRLPAEFPVYPKARVQEAAGFDGGICDIRVVSFTTPAPLQNVVDYYYTRAVKSGFDAEHQIRAGMHILGGVRSKDDGAYFITFEPNIRGGTAVDIVANNGR